MHQNLIPTVRRVLDRLASGEAFNQVIEDTGITAKLTQIAASERDAEKRINAVIDQQGWNDESRLIHLEGFIRDAGLFGALASHMEAVALEENTDSAVLSDELDRSAWDDEVFDVLENELDIDRSSAQSLVMAKPDQLQAAFDGGQSALNAARAFIAANITPVC